MIVGNLMSTGLVTCRPDDSLATAAERMWQHDCGIVAVIDDEQHVVGVVTDRDVCMAAWTQGRTLADVSVRTAMSRAVHTVRKGDSVEDAQALMRVQQVRRLPVVEDGGRLVGFLSVNDLARSAAQRGDGVTSDDVVLTLAAIGRPPPAVAATKPGNGKGARRKLHEQLDELRTLRDSIRVKMHLAGLDAKDALSEIEPKITRLEHEVTGAAEDAAARLTKSVERIRKSLRSIQHKAPLLSANSRRIDPQRNDV